MTTLDLPTTAVPTTAALVGAASDDAGRPGRGGAYALIASCALVFLSMCMIPWDNVGTAGYVEFNREHATAAAWAAVVLHYGFLLMVPGALALARAGKARMPRLAGTASVLAWLGAGLSGIVVVDYYDIAIASNLPTDQAVRLTEATHDHWQGLLIQLPSMFGLMIGIVLAAVAARRARVVPLAPVLVLPVGFFVFMAGASQIVPALIGTALMATATAWLGLALLRRS